MNRLGNRTTSSKRVGTKSMHKKELIYAGKNRIIYPGKPNVDYIKENKAVQETKRAH